jgi:hypothetical protein
MSYALNDTPNTSLEETASNAAKAPKTLIDASTGAMTGSLRPKGLILTKQQIIDLYLYEQKGLHLPTATADVSSYLGYDQANPPGRGLAVSDFAKTFTIIKSHASQWDGLRQRIKKVGSELKVFASSIINTGKHMTLALEQIAALKLLKEYGIKTLEDLRRVEAEMGSKFPGIKLDEDDMQSVSTITAMLDALQKKIDAQAHQTEQLKTDLDRFSLELATDVRPQITYQLTAIDNNTFKDDVVRLQSEIEDLSKEVDEKNASYKQMVIDSLKSASSLNMIGLGMAIYIGVEAEKVRKERNALKAQRDAKNAEMGTKSKVLKRLNDVKADLQDLEFLSLQADAATQNLVTVWNALHLYVRTSKEQSDAFTDALQVSLLAYHFDEVMDPWKYILSDADALYAVFAEADEDIKKLPRTV